MNTERFAFPGHDGTELAARLDHAQGAPLATAIFAHCFTCGKDIAAARRIASRLTTLGISVLRFDFTGLGQSQGEFHETTFTSNARDIVAAAHALEKRGMAPDLLIGHSLGGAAVLRAASDLPGAKAVVTLGAPYDPEHVTHNFGDALDHIARDGSAEVQLGGRPVRIGKALLDDVRGADLKRPIANLKRALLVMHAPLDAVVGLDNATRIFTTARHPKSFVTLDGADHLISNPRDAEYAAEVIAAWVTHYLDLPEPVAPVGAPEGVVRVSEADAGGFLQHIAAGPRHRAAADEPEAYGGTDEGMSPYGFLAAGLGACTSMTIRMYARRKGWPLSHVSVDVTHDKVHAQDAGHGDAKVDHFRRSITLSGALDDRQRQRLLEIANKCPVHRTLERGAEITTELAGGK